MRRISVEPMTRLAPLSRWLGLLAVVLALLSVGGVRFGGIPPINGLVVYAAALTSAALAAVAAAGALTRIWRQGGQGTGLAVRGLLLALGVMLPAAWFGTLAVRLPMLNDVTTDLSEPPSFGRSRAAIDTRGGLVVPEFNTATAQEHQDAYPELQPILVDAAPDEAMTLALRAATNLGWRVLDSVAPAGRMGIGRIEATDRSLIFGFQDDITIRVRPALNETRLDLRAASRIGRHDFGANARRIIAFQKEIEGLVSQR
jgi:uncharacterized protein (DUF1499 family)